MTDWRLDPNLGNEMPSDSRKYTTYRSNTSCTLSCSERSDRSTKCGLWVAKLATGPCNRQLDGNMLLVQQLSYLQSNNKLAHLASFCGT